MESSKIIIDRAKKRFKELDHKEYDWRSFYSGFIEATMEEKLSKLEDGDSFSLDLFFAKTKEDLEIAREEMNSEHLNIRLKGVGKFHTIKGIRDGIKNGEFRADLKADTDMKKEDLKDLFEKKNERGYTYKCLAQDELGKCEQHCGGSWCEKY